MDETNKQIIQDVANQLNNSITTNWNSGDLEQWSNHAKRMKNTIIAVVPILKTLAGAKPSETKTTDKKEQKVIMTDKQYVINELIDKGWKVISVTPPSPTCGEFCFLLER